MEQIKTPVTIYRDDCPEGKIVEKYQADVLVAKNGWKVKKNPVVSIVEPTSTTPSPTHDSSLGKKPKSASRKRGK